MKVAGIFAGFVVAIASEVAAEACPWTSGKCKNSEGQCASCVKSQWYDSDHKCVCGPAGADWITKDQCTPCTSELEVASDTCDGSSLCPGYADGDCSCTPGSGWYMWTCTKRQGATIPTTWCSLPGCDCNTAEVSLESEVAVEACPWTSGKCMNSEGQCASCDKSQWYDSDHKCTCGPAAADWITKDQCTPCTSELEVAAEACPWTSGKCMNSEGQCASCDKSQWYDSDHKCTCGPAAADWITKDQCTPCTSELEVASDTCDGSSLCPGYADGDCSCTPGSGWYMWTCTKRQGAAIPTTWCSLPGCDCNTAATFTV